MLAEIPPTVIPDANPNVVHLRRRSLSRLPPFGLGDSKYNLSGFIATASLAALDSVPAGPVRNRARALSAIRTRIERRFRESKIWRASAETFRSPNNIWHADVVTCCMLLSEWLHMLREHVLADNE